MSYYSPCYNVSGLPAYQFPSAQAVPGNQVGMMAPSGSTITGTQSTAGTQSTGVSVTPSYPGQLPVEQSYVENILRMNLQKKAKFYMTYENNNQWNAKIFEGIIEAAGRDHIIIRDPKTNKRFLLLTLNLDYIEFDEPLTYTLPFGSGQIGNRSS